MDGNLNLVNNMKNEDTEAKELSKAFDELLSQMFTKEELKDMEVKYNQLLKEREEPPTHNED
jgi:hypothetical protein